MALALAAAAAGGCAFLHETNAEPEGAPRKETLWAVTDAAELIRINAGQPRRVLERRRLAGLPAGERLLGIDYRVARGTLYALSSGGHLYTLGTKSGRLTRLGKGPAITLAGMRFAAAAYTYNKHDERLTTNYAIDTRAGTLVMQGSREGVQPVVSPNTGTVFTVGALGTGPVDDASFDIADIGNTALAALRQNGRTRLHLLDLQSGRAVPLGTVGDGRALWGIAIEP